MRKRDPQEGVPKGANRRGFIRGSSLILAAALPKTQAPGAASRVALVGCDRRGTQLAAHMIEGGAKLVALADVQSHRMQQSRRGLRSRGKERLNGQEALITLPTANAFTTSCLQPLWVAKPDFVVFSGELSDSLPAVLECLNCGIDCYLDDIASLEVRDLFAIRDAAVHGQSACSAGSGTSYLPRFQSAMSELHRLRSKQVEHYSATCNDWK